MFFRGWFRYFSFSFAMSRCSLDKIIHVLKKKIRKKKKEKRGSDEKMMTKIKREKKYDSKERRRSGRS